MPKKASWPPRGYGCLECGFSSPFFSQFADHDCNTVKQERENREQGRV